MEQNGVGLSEKKVRKLHQVVGLLVGAYGPPDRRGRRKTGRTIRLVGHSGPSTSSMRAPNSRTVVVSPRWISTNWRRTLKPWDFLSAPSVQAAACGTARRSFARGWPGRPTDA